MTDQYIGNVVSLLHFNGANGSTNFKDSATTLNWTALGDAVISTTRSKFGGSSYYKPGAGDNYLTTPSTPDLNMGLNDFTIELWVYPITRAEYNFPIAKVEAVNHNNFRFGYTSTGTLYVHCAGIESAVGTSANTITINKWQHMALTRMGTTARVFVNGVLKGTWEDASDMNNDTPVFIGAEGNGHNGFSGYIDEVRITKGVCRYTKSFTPSTTQFVDPIRWWTAAPNLTPVAAWDAARVSGAQLLDGVGNSNITATSEFTTINFPFTGVAGNSNPMMLTTPVPIPSVGVVAGFWSPKRRNVLLSKDESGSSYALHLSSDGSWYSNNQGTYSTYAQFGEIGKRYFVAMVTRGTDSILYIDGTLIGSPISSSHTMSHIGQIGYQGNGNEFNLDADEYLHAVGVWSGEATQDDIKAIEAAARLALKGVETKFRGFAAPIGRTYSNLPLSYPALSIGISNVIGQYNTAFSGSGRIAGTIKEKGSPDQPLHRRVQLYDEMRSMLVAQTWSNPTTGAYLFENIDTSLTYTVISYDYTGEYRAVIANGIKSTV